jgi:hypothetical protein
LTPLEFKYALEMGFGRAIQHLRAHDPAPYQEIILQACLNFTGLNLQTDGGRHEYLFEAMQLSANPSAIQNKILETLTYLGEDGESNQQVVDLVATIAMNGSAKAKQAILNLHLVDPEENGRYGVPCSEAIIKLDGLPGLSMVLGRFGNAMLFDSELEADDSILRFAQQTLGTDVVHDALDGWIKIDSSIAAFIKSVRQQEKRSQARGKHLPLGDWTFEQMAAFVAKPKPVSGWHVASGWGKLTSVQNLQLAAQRLEIAKDDQEALPWLAVFRRREFPGSIEKILEFAKSENPALANCAIGALEHLKDPKVRDFALAYRGLSDQHFAFALDALRHNYQPGDASFILHVMQQITDDDAFDSHARNIMDIFETNPTPEARAILLDVYARLRCLHCRPRCVKLLDAIGVLPEVILEECRFDASLDVRSWAQEKLEM